MKYPRIALIISEQHIVPAGGADQRLAENTIIGEWKAAGPYTFVDLDAAAGKVKGPAFSGEANAETVRQYANVLDADLFVFGSATATRLPGDISSMMNDAQGSLKNMISCRSAISVRAFLPDSGEVVATSDAGKGAVALGELACEKMAVKAAAKALSVDLERKLLSEWNQRVMGSARVRLRVKGIDFSGVKDLKSQLANGFKAISSVTQRSFADGVAEFDLKVDGGDAEALADAFASKGFGKQKLKVTGATSNTITLEAVK